MVSLSLFISVSDVTHAHTHHHQSAIDWISVEEGALRTQSGSRVGVKQPIRAGILDHVTPTRSLVRDT